MWVNKANPDMKNYQAGTDPNANHCIGRPCLYVTVPEVKLLGRPGSVCRLILAPKVGGKGRLPVLNSRLTGTRRGPFNSTPMGGQSDFVWLPARTMHPRGGASYAW